jgi:SAM-dependent methyltransferase
MTPGYYATGEELKAKNLIASPTLDVERWVVDQLSLDGVVDAMDAGAGWGRFARVLLGRHPDVRLVCSDLSPGMLATCGATLDAEGFAAPLVAADVRALPFRAAAFDLVMANHMLYELDDPVPAASELARVMREDGTLVATTYSDRVRVHLIELHQQALTDVGLDPGVETASTFSLENGTAVLGQAFAQVEVRTLVDERALAVDQLADTYLHTGRYLDVLRDDALSRDARQRLAGAFLARARQVEDEEGGLFARTVWAFFLGRHPRSR